MTALQLYTQYCEKIGDPQRAAIVTLAEIIQSEHATPHDGKPLTVKQAAEAMAISQRKVYELCELGLLRHTTNPIRIRPADIEAYQNSMRHCLPAGLRHL
jgi:hypothetical protein